MNVVTIKNKILLLFIDETLNRLIEFVYFIKLNLKNAYYRIQIKIDNKWKIVFRTRYEFFEYAMMFFELTNALTTFQFSMNKIFAKLMNKLCVLFLNDIFIYFRTKKKTLTSRENDAETFIKIQFFCQFDQKQIYATIDRIFQLYHQ